MIIGSELIMKKNIFRKSASLLAASTMLLSLVSCSSSAENQSQSPQSFMAEQLSDKAYKRSLMEVPEDLIAIYKLKPYDNNEKIFLLGGSMKTTPVFYTVDPNFENFQQFEVPDFNIGQSYDIDIQSDGSIITVINNVDYGDLPDPDPYSEDYDEELYESAAEYSVLINKCSSDGDFISSNVIDGIYDFESPDNVMICGLFCGDDDNVVVLINSTYYGVSIDGSFYGEIKLDSAEKSIKEYGKNSDGDVVCAVDCGEKNIKVCEIDIPSTKLKESSTTYNITEGITSPLVPGTNGYSVYIPTRGTIYGVKESDGSVEAIFSVKDSDLNPNELDDIIFDSDGVLYISEISYTSLSAKLYRYVECDPAELENLPVITIGCRYEDYLLKDYISEVNDTQSEYRVVLKDYSEYESSDNLDGDTNQMVIDLLSGDAPDIFLMDGLEQYDLGSKGVLCDLYDFIDNDSSLSHDSFNANIIRFAEKDGHLYSLPSCFRIHTTVGKTEFVGDKENWTFDDFVAAHDAMPEGMTIDGYPECRNTMLSCMNLNSFLDMDNFTCNFNSDEFIKQIKFCNEFPSVESLYSDVELKLWEDKTEEEQSEEITYQRLMYRNNNALRRYICLMNFYNFHEVIAGEFDRADITFVGNISTDGKGTSVELVRTFAITNSSPNKELAWDIIRYFYTDEYYSKGNDSFPITNSGLEQWAKRTLEPEIYVDSDYTGQYYYLGGSEKIEMGIPIQADIDCVMDIINNVDTVEQSHFYETSNIIYEEIHSYFNGEKTAEECAEMIQNRVSLFLGEKK